MTLQKFISKLKWRQILIHLIASWFFMHAFGMFSYLYDTRLVDIVRQSGEQGISKALTDNNINAPELTSFVFWINISGFAGLLAAFVISLVISLRRHWFWVNALFVFILAYLLFRFNFTGGNSVHRFFGQFSGKFSNSSVEFVLKGFVLLLIGALIFFLRQANRFIENRKSL